jgi:transcriptional regulator GlxA family with amidase domain
MTDTSTTRRSVGIFIFDGVEVLDFAGPFEVLANALPAGKMAVDSLLFNVVTIAPEDRLVRCAGGLLVQPHHTLRNHPPLDILILSGGDICQVSENPTVLDWIVQEHKKAEILASVCTGAALLAETGLLDGGPATTHWASVDKMRKMIPAVDMLADQRVVDRGRVITSAGISAGIDMALYLVARLHGSESAAWTARLMEYDWDPQKVPEPSLSS